MSDELAGGSLKSFVSIYCTKCDFQIMLLYVSECADQGVVIIKSIYSDASNINDSFDSSQDFAKFS